jgi:hypothetical protein
MAKPDLSKVPEFYKGYVENVQTMEVLEALRRSSKNMSELLSSIPETKGDHRYAPGKWSIKEMLRHMNDAERIFAYRALRFSRNDKTALSSFDENAYAPESNAGSKSIKELSVELLNLRKTTIDLFESFTEEMMSREGTASNKNMSVLTLGYVIAGHEVHHFNILRDRYLK